MPDSHVLRTLDVSTRALKRAQYEAFTFSLLDGDVLVRNESHADPADHEYRVTISDGRPVACTCPADARSKQACKHRVAVAIRRPILDAAVTMQTLASQRSPDPPECDTPSSETT